MTRLTAELGIDEGEKYSHSSNANNNFTIRRISNANSKYQY